MDLLSRLLGLLGDALTPEDVRENLERASEHLLRKEYAQAEEEARLALSRRKDVPRAYLLLGLARRGLGDLEGARAALREGLRRAPGDGGAHLALAECELALGDCARALREATLAREAGAPAAEAALLLARGHLKRGERALAREALESLAALPVPREVKELLGSLRLEAGDLAGALVLFEELGRDLAARPGELAGLARTYLALGRPAEALPHALRALSEAPGDPAMSVLVGDLHAKVGNHESALAAYERALELDPRSLEALRGVASSQLALGRLAEARAAFERVLSLAPQDPEARAGLDRAALLERLAGQARVREAAAAEETRLGLRPDELYALVVRTHRLLGASPEVADLVPAAAALRENYDRPLTLAIAGEFNAGKSTLLNALLGEAVAPMGVTPTTAAVNVFVHGTRRAARVVMRDGSATEVDLAEVQAFIDRRRKAGDASVHHVEIVWPAEPLREVSLVDTPGFNAAQEEHEAVARSFLARADAVLWIFDAAHAGSASERGAIEALGPLRGKVVGVLNKADQLAREDLSQVLDHLRQSFAGEVAEWTAVSAREALRARQEGSEERLARSGFSDLWSLLTARFFSRAWAVKREVTRARLAELLQKTRGRAERARVEASAAAQQGALRRAQAHEVERRLAQEVATALEAMHREGIEHLCSETAREALDAIRREPGKLAALFGPRLTEADFDFLARLVGDRLRDHLKALGDRAAAEVRRLGSAEISAWREAPVSARRAAEPLLGFALRAVEEAQTDLREGPFAQALAYARGFLEGGGVSRAAGEIARARTVEEARGALGRALPHSLPWREPFVAWARAFARVLEEVAASVERQGSAARVEIEGRLVAPLEEIEHRLAACEGTPEDGGRPTGTLWARGAS
jgi:tetratricopeptide (TPR) repeat protein